jgi:peptidoglycan/LPS O-acetylase OafA/YrhL
MEKTSTNRLLALEGLRGVAAIVVVIFHVCMAFLPAMMTADWSAQHYGFEDNVYNSPFVVFISGIFGVAIFFVLSGFVLSIRFFQTDDSSVIKKLAAKRYLRLMIPALASIMLVWLLMSLGAMHNLDAAQITHSTWLATYQNFVPSFFDALFQGSANIFISNAGIMQYNNVTWTMLYEFIGSVVVFAFCLLFGKSKRRPYIYAIMLFVTINTWFVAFILGLMLADLYANRNKLFAGRWWKYTLIVGLFLGGYSLSILSQSKLYASIQIANFNFYQDQSLLLSVGAFLVVASILGSPLLQRIFTKISRLGKYTFSLYLVHLPLLYSLCVGVFLWLIHSFHGIHYAVAAAVSAGIFFIVTAITTWLFERYIDAPAIRLSNRFAGFILQSPVREKTDNIENEAP